MDLPELARHRVETFEIAWLTTVTGRGAPAPNPVWFVPEGPALVVFVQPHSAKARNAAARPRVTLHFETVDPGGADVVVIHGSAAVEPGMKPSAQPGFFAKYSATMAEIGLSAEEMDTYDTRIRISPERVRIGI